MCSEKILVVCIYSHFSNDVFKNFKKSIYTYYIYLWPAVGFYLYVDIMATYLPYLFILENIEFNSVYSTSKCYLSNYTYNRLAIHGIEVW